MEVNVIKKFLNPCGYRIAQEVCQGSNTSYLYLVGVGFEPQIRTPAIITEMSYGSYGSRQGNAKTVDSVLPHSVRLLIECSALHTAACDAVSAVHEAANNAAFLQSENYRRPER